MYSNLVHKKLPTKLSLLKIMEIALLNSYNVSTEKIAGRAKWWKPSCITIKQYGSESKLRDSELAPPDLIPPNIRETNLTAWHR